MEKIIPEAVFVTPSTGLRGIDYNQFPPIFVKALQDLQNEVNDLKQQLDDLKKNNNLK